MLYSIIQLGFELGRYEAATAVAALQIVAVELGYGDFAEYCCCEGLNSDDCRAMPTLTRLIGEAVH